MKKNDDYKNLPVSFLDDGTTIGEAEETIELLDAVIEFTEKVVTDKKAELERHEQQN